MDEHSILDRIGQLVDEERARLKAVDESLDQCWDLLRRRRAARATGSDADAVQPRDITEVEGYLQ